MTNTIKITKKVLTVVLSAAVLCCSLFCVPMLASAETNYGDWVAQSVFNGDFEAGIEGAEPYGWGKTAVDYATGQKYYRQAFLDAYTLTTEIDNGNKVLAITKDGSGYIAAESLPVAVNANTDYQISFDYMLKEYIAQTGAANVNYLGTRLYIEEFDAEGNTLNTTGNDTAEGGKGEYTVLTQLYSTSDTITAVDADWISVTRAFKTKSNTASVKIYIWVGGQYQMASITLVDNISIEKLGYNLDFAVKTNQADGGRAVGLIGPAGWNIVGSPGSGKVTGGPAVYANYFKATSATVEGRGDVALVQYVSGSGYALLQSPFIASAPSEVVDISVDVKHLRLDADGTSYIQPSRGFYINLACYDADYNLIGEAVTSAIWGAMSDWTTKTAALTTVEGTVYIKVGFFINYLTGDYTANTNAKNFEMYFDNVTVQSSSIAGFNGDFEVGKSGSVPYNWTETAFESNGTKTDPTDTNKVNSFLNSNELTTVVEADGNKAASVAKKGAGYIGVTSTPISVYPLTEYTLAFDYKTVLPTGVDGQTNSNYYGARIIVGEVDADGNETLTVVYTDTVFHENWTTYTTKFATAATTKSVVLYLWSGSDMNYNITTYFDNVVFERETKFDGKFENNQVGSQPFGWFETAMTNGVVKETVANTIKAYKNSNTLTTAEENGNKVLSVVKDGAGYIGATSVHIPVKPNTTYTFSYDYKTASPTGVDGTTDSMFFGIGNNVGLWDANGSETMAGAYQDKTLHNTWTNYSRTITTGENTISVVLYLWSGSNMNYGMTSYWDNVSFTCEETVNYDKTDLSFVLLDGVDVDGNNETDILDLVKVKVAYNAAADVNKNGVVNAEDTVYVRAAILGYTSYEQLRALF